MNMRVAVYYKNSDVRVEERPRPVAARGEILVKVVASGICGSDVMEWYRIKKAPLVLGHEIAGVIEEVGEGVTRYKKGERVFVSHHVPCNTCEYCLGGHHTACHTLHTTNYDPGGFSEYIRIPPINVDRGVFPLPDEVSFDEGVFVEPLACVVRGQRLARVKPGMSVVVLGGGISGLLHLLLAKACGASRVIVTDIDEYRLEFARKLGADAVINAKDDVPGLIRRANGGRPVQCAIVCTGATSAFNQALESVDAGGVILCFAPTNPGVNLSVPVNDFWRNEMTLITSYANSPHDAMIALELLRSKSVQAECLVTHRLPLSETVRGFQLVADARQSMKVIVYPQK